MADSRVSTALVSLLAIAFAVAAPSVPAAVAVDAVRVVSDTQIDGNLTRIDVYSAAMDRVITNHVIRAANPSAPTLYLLTGIGGGEDGVSWWDSTDIRRFFADKNVNVVLPIGGAFSMYTDWIADDPMIGRERWQTYLSRELPPVIDAQLNTSGRNAIAGVSMSAGSAVDLAIQAPDLYQAVGAYSGCPWAADVLGTALISSQVIGGRGNPLNMWGEPGSPTWHAHDAFARAGALAGKAIYLSAASGIPGDIDKGGLPSPPVEAAASLCTTAFAARLNELGVPATHVDRKTGSHTWGLFETDLRNSWSVLARGLGAE
ncbi:S-formylglutathione hydrolase FrmB [Nocardia tenerifensis]|uniref:S-formylglutathione hydrolase FrmB n=1 Tax=Nocardia tenerifensis TaxID=228006 RepID=A0A318KBC7_9NOCA|nr:alpha/beta hydrolase family protein [Nocardia tenerifensis]PXX71426.1 S-formylglutathione hydrolase FrmB [Nocardia tenerifensis]